MSIQPAIKSNPVRHVSWQFLMRYLHWFSLWISPLPNLNWLTAGLIVQQRCLLLVGVDTLSFVFYFWVTRLIFAFTCITHIGLLLFWGNWNTLVCLRNCDFYNIIMLNLSFSQNNYLDNSCLKNENSYFNNNLTISINSIVWYSMVWHIGLNEDCMTWNALYMVWNDFEWHNSAPSGMLWN